MDIARLRDVQSRERTTDSLQELPDSFYSDVASYIAELKAERERAADEADDPFADDDVNRLTDEIQTAEQVAESLYERRVGKIVKQASFAAAGMGEADDGLTTEEQELYDDLVGRIEENKSRVLDVLAGETDPDAGAKTRTDPESGVNAAALMGDGAKDHASTEHPESERPDPERTEPAPPDPPGEGTPDASAAETTPGASEAETPPESAPAAAANHGDTTATADVGEDGKTSPGEGNEDAVEGIDDPEENRETVRITKDVGEIFGVDERTYKLESEDVVSLPEVNAGALVERDAATKLE